MWEYRDNKAVFISDVQHCSYKQQRNTYFHLKMYSYIPVIYLFVIIFNDKT